MKSINLPFTKDLIDSLRSGDELLLNGTIYTGRDAAHKRLCETVRKNEETPFPFNDNVIYYVGPSPARPPRPIGAAGPTTSSRMDAYAKILIPLGLKVMIGKGQRSEEIKELIKKENGLYLTVTGGIAALVAKSIKTTAVIAYEDLGPEAVYKFEVENFPVIVAYDAHGNDLFEDGIKKYRSR